jgi:predicted nucleic acid-binding protein
MIVVDVNLLIYAVNEDAPLHWKARSWLEAAVSGTETVGLAWTVLLAFLRLTTRAGLFQTPLDVDTAFEIVDA